MGLNLPDISGQKIGNWTILCRDVETNAKNARIWKCQCECGEIRSMNTNAIKKRKSCNICAGQNKNLKGQTFGKWKVLYQDFEKESRLKYWICKCECGQIVSVLASSLLSGGSSKCCLCANNSFKDLTNLQFYNWKVLLKSDKPKYWKCECKCGNICEILGSSITSGKTTKCKLCAIKKQTKPNIYEDIQNWYWNSLKRGAKTRNINFKIEPQDIWNCFIKQNKKCVLSGLDIQFGSFKKVTASVDRIDNLKGYEIDNIQIVHKKFNRFKNKYSQQEFIEMCKMVASYNA